MNWEYKTVKLKVSDIWGNVGMNPEKADEFINQFGLQGWELVSVIDLNQSMGQSKEVVIFFKRPLA
jgi:hypothetical protein